jgi:hypothetical protein
MTGKIIIFNFILLCLFEKFSLLIATLLLPGLLFNTEDGVY